MMWHTWTLQSASEDYLYSPISYTVSPHSPTASLTKTPLLFEICCCIHWMCSVPEMHLWSWHGYSSFFKALPWCAVLPVVLSSHSQASCCTLLLPHTGTDPVELKCISCAPLHTALGALLPPASDSASAMFSCTVTCHMSHTWQAFIMSDVCWLSQKKKGHRKNFSKADL